MERFILYLQKKNSNMSITPAITSPIIMGIFVRGGVAVAFWTGVSGSIILGRGRVDGMNVGLSVMLVGVGVDSIVEVEVTSAIFEVSAGSTTTGGIVGSLTVVVGCGMGGAGGSGAGGLTGALLHGLRKFLNMFGCFNPYLHRIPMGVTLCHSQVAKQFSSVSPRALEMASQNSPKYATALLV